MNPETILNNAAVIGARYRRGLLTYAELNAECWQLTHELAFYSHTDAQWKQRQASWEDHPDTQLEFWNEMFEEVYSQAIA